MEKNYNHKTAELEAQQKWQQEGTYLAKNNDGELYSIDTPPPTVSGSLHIGHIFSYTQTDIIARYKRMQGFSVFYPFGFDDNGLATERFVEKKLDIRAHTLKRSDFIKLCLQETHKAEEQFKQLWLKMGLSVDWDMCYSTISDRTRRLSQASFIELFKKGFIYRTNEPALYCTTCRTSVAQAELEDVEKPSLFNDIAFQDEDGQDLIISTTRPELLSSCVALFYNPFDERYSYYRGKQATVPIFGYKVPILADEAVNMEKGTGLVMCCTFGDKLDIEWWKKHHLPYKQSIGLDGKWTQETGVLAGLNFMQAREKILEELKSRGLLLRQRAITHAVNVHERCKKEIEYLLLSQWFLKILPYKNKFIELADQINWYPSFMKIRYTNWVENISWDWCLSRQRFYGIPFPVWHCQECNEVIVADIKDLPLDPQETEVKGTCPQCKSSDIKPDTDVMDTWNTSSLTPYICYEFYKQSKSSESADEIFTQAVSDNFIPMSMRPQAHDIIRTWAFYTIVKSWMHNETIPWRNVVISGHVLSDSKEKLSKSKDGGKLSPETLLEHNPADAIRYWTASGNLGHDTAFSENQLKIGNRLITKLWNAFRFIQEHTAEVNIDERPQDFGVINEWLLHQVSLTFEQYEKQLELNEMSLALDHVEKFFWHSFCDNYIEIVKHQLFNPQNFNPVEVTATRWTLYHVGLRIIQMYAPFMPYVTEALYGTLYKDKFGISSIHQTKFAIAQIEYEFSQSLPIVQQLIELVATVRRLKTEKQLSLKTELRELTLISEDQAALDTLQSLEAIIKGVAQAQAILYQKSASKQSEIRQIGENWVMAITV